MEDSVTEPLVRHDAAGYVPLLAESYRVIGGTEIRFALRKDVRFHDGRPFTAVDAQASIDAARRRAPRLRAALADVAAVEVWSARDLRVVLRRENAYVLRALAEVPIVPAPEVGARQPSGTGPYRVAEWRHGELIRLQRNPAYWGKAAAIDTIDFLIIGDAALALTMAQRREIDILPSLIPEHWPEQTAAPRIVESFAPLELAPPRLIALVLNLRKPPFDDERVRRAAAMLIDRGRLTREAWHGLARPAVGLVWPGGLGDGDAAPAPPYDPVRAMLLLEEAGWRAEKDGVRARDGVKLRITFVGVGAPVDPERDLIVAGLRRGGFGIDLAVADAASFLERLRAANLDAALLDYRGRVDEDLSPFLVAGGGRNFGGLSSAPIDAACAALRGAWEPAERRPLATELGKLVAAELPFIPLVAPAPHGLVARRVAGLLVRDGWFLLRDVSLLK